MKNDNIGNINPEEMMKSSGISPTPNRILVMRQILKSPRPQSLGELEAAIGTMDKSSILRALMILHNKHLIHSIEDGKGVVKYELCHGFDEESEADKDYHVHFYCEECGITECLDNIPVPRIEIPEDYLILAYNYMIKGICPKCKNRNINKIK